MDRRWIADVSWQAKDPVSAVAALSCIGGGRSGCCIPPADTPQPNPTTTPFRKRITDSRTPIVQLRSLGFKLASSPPRKLATTPTLFLYYIAERIHACRSTHRGGSCKRRCRDCCVCWVRVRRQQP